MVGESRAAAGHPVADIQPRVASRLHDNARARVAERNRLVELCLHLFESGEDAFGLHLADDLLHLVGHLQRLADDALLGELGEHSLGTCAHEARGGRDDRALTLAQRRRNFREPHFACLERLQYLLHINLIYLYVKHCGK
ncbi:MAG: hypothetical protein J6M55_04665 [Paludibacteraceae bacterium]|nr:hypothetical protein [Paludibacteraceae bacterium]